MRRAVVVLSALTFLAGCAGGQRRSPAVTALEMTPPTDWAGPVMHGEPPQADWWTGFADPGLSAAIETALERNRDLQAAAARVAAAAAEARIAGAAAKPSVGVGLDASRQRQNFVGFPLPGGGVLSTTSSRFAGGVTVSWEADLWGRLQANTRAAVARVEASRNDHQAARLSLAGQTARLWFAIAEAREQLALARRTAESFAALAEQIRQRYRRGVRPAIDLRLALSNRASAEAQVELRRRQLDAARRQLAVLLADYPGAVPSDAAALTDLALVPSVPAGLPGELLARRPDLVAAEWRLLAADQRWLSARRALYPRLSLTGGGGTVSDQLSDLLDGDFRVWSLLANLTQPLFQGGRLRAGVDLAAAGQDEALARYGAAVLQAFAEVETALAAETFLQQQESRIDEAAKQLVAAERLAEDRYRRGVGDYLTVLEAQTRSFSARSNLLDVRRARLDNRVALHLALGGGFRADPRPDRPHSAGGALQPLASPPAAATDPIGAGPSASAAADSEPSAAARARASGLRGARR